MNWHHFPLFSFFFKSYISVTPSETRSGLKQWVCVAMHMCCGPYSSIFLVHFMFLCDTIQSVLVMDDLFYWFVYHFNDFTSFFHFNFALVNGPFFDAIIMFTVQIVYCWRVWRLGRWRAIPGVAAFASFFQRSSQDRKVDPLAYSSRSLRWSVGYLSAFMWMTSLFNISCLLTSYRVRLRILLRPEKISLLKRSAFKIHANDVSDPVT